MPRIGFKTGNDTLRSVLGNGFFYNVPRFQRDYSWDLPQWEDLWYDLTALRQDPDESSHYMGYLVLQSGDQKNFRIIDGQQRLTTLSLVILAAIKHLQTLSEGGIDAKNNMQRADQLRRSYIGYLDPVTLIAHSKLSLNRNDDGYYRDYLVPLIHLPQRNLKVSEHLLRRCFEYFFERIADDLTKIIDDEKGKFVASLVENICDALFFTVITVSDELNAYRVFETLNSRGVQLSSTDLVKNFLFSLLDNGNNSQRELNNLEERWERIVSRLQKEKFPTFLRFHRNSRYKFSRHADLFKNIRKSVTSPAEVFQLLREMEEDLDYYLALVYPETSSLPLTENKELCVLKLFGVRQAFPLLLAAKRKFAEDDYIKLLRIVKVVSFRYSIIGNYSPSDLEQVYAKAAQSISEGEISSLLQCIKALSSVYIDDQRFCYDFSQKIFKTNNSRTKKIVRYVLCELEQFAGGHKPDFCSETYNIEHILPQQAEDGWGGLSFQQMQALTYRLGNMILLNDTDNRDLGNKSYAEKKALFARSQFLTTQKVVQDFKEEWNAQSIAARQLYMAKQAKSIWKVAQLDA